VPVEQTWNLADIFPSDEAWEAELAACEKDVGTVTQYKGRFAEGPKTLLACLDAFEDFAKRLYKVGSYASYKLSTDGTDPANQNKAARFGSVAAAVQSQLTFIKAELLSLPEGTLERYIAEEPGLKSLEHYLSLLVREKPYMLSPETESVLASLSEITNAPAK